MATPRLAATLVIRTSRIYTSHSNRGVRSLPVSSTRSAAPALKSSQFRYYSQESRLSKIYSFSDVKVLSEKPEPNCILIDTREPSELRITGTIPGALNIPITSQPDSFFITAEEFEDRYGFERPEKGQEMVFYCKSGVRSRAAAELARQAGWEKVGEYPGSWLDWERNGGKKSDGIS